MVTITTNSWIRVGGFLGNGVDSNTKLNNCLAIGNIFGTSTGDYVDAGAFFGNIGGLYPAINNCIATGNVSSIVPSGKSAKAGVIGGVYGTYGPILLQNNYRYINQAFYRREGIKEYTNPTNSSGTTCTATNLNTQSFYTSTLGWSTSDWDFSGLDFLNGKYPKLKWQAA